MALLAKIIPQSGDTSIINRVDAAVATASLGSPSLVTQTVGGELAYSITGINAGYALTLPTKVINPNTPTTGVTIALRFRTGQAHSATARSLCYAPSSTDISNSFCVATNSSGLMGFGPGGARITTEPDASYSGNWRTVVYRTKLTGVGALTGDQWNSVSASSANTPDRTSSNSGITTVYTLTNAILRAHADNGGGAGTIHIAAAAVWDSELTDAECRSAENDLLGFLGGGGNTGALAASESGADAFASSGQVSTSGSLAASEAGADTFSASGGNVVQGTLTASESGADVLSASGTVSGSGVSGTLAASESGSDGFLAVAPGVGVITLPETMRTMGNMNAGLWASASVTIAFVDSTATQIVATHAISTDASGTLSKYAFADALLVAGRSYVLLPFVGSVASGTPGQGARLAAA